MMTESTEERSHPLEQITTQADAPEEKEVIESEKIAAPMKRPSRVMPPKLSPLKIDEPAIIIDDNLNIAWQNKAAISELWQGIGIANNGNPTPNLLDLIFDPHFQRKVENWRKWALFFIQQAHHMLSDERMEHCIELRNDDQQQILKELLKTTPPVEERIVYNGRIRQLHNDGHIASFWVVATQFEQGRYFVFKSSRQSDQASPELISADIDRRFDLLRRQIHPAPMPFYILSAQLNKSHILRTEMLAEEYSQLLMRLYKQAIACIEKHGGIFIKHTSSDFLACFLPDAQHPVQPMQVLECALALKNQMAELGREWKIRKGWLHDIELNMGLHWTEEYVGMVTSSIGENLAAFGDAQRIATVLSSLATDGQIWATKDVINQIAPLDQKKLRFGIFRKGHPHQVLISKCFLRLKELTPADIETPPAIGGELGALAATQIFDRHR